MLTVALEGPQVEDYLMYDVIGVVLQLPPTDAAAGRLLRTPQA